MNLWGSARVEDPERSITNLNGVRMPKAVWKGEVIAESDDTVVVEGNHYFPRASVSDKFLVESDKHTVCPWKGQASYYTIVVGDERNENAAWTYLKPKPAASNIGKRIAFYKGVKIVHDTENGATSESGLLQRLTGLLSR